MLNKEALRNRNVEGRDEQEEETTIEELSKKFATMYKKPPFQVRSLFLFPTQ
jgi:hypothetical protein